VYLLTQAKNGVKLMEAKDSSADVGMRIEAPGRMIGVKATMTMLANALTKALKRQVVDETGLSGAYSFRLAYTPDPKPGMEPGDGPSVFTALEEQLGLRLKAGRGPVAVLVIDSAQKPAAN
jgi:uncharacterized protein (TIGR03435 family)